ncbi:MAG: nucleotidyl transferase [Candidatus Latescibacteria bacterium 4484_107]|nr:MAG: nucleotidyl transferase [Candidatus Latescibacteria bacterium 4484_107]
MKAFLLAAGEGTRLRPLTETTPKCLVPICGRPLLAYWFDLFRRHGIGEVLINTHHLADQVRAYVRSVEGVRVSVIYEPELLGSAGTLYANRDFVKGEDAFFILYADNLTNANLNALAAFHQSHSGIVTMGLFETSVPRQCGIVQLDSEARIVDFVEKPSHPKSNLANAGIFVAQPGLFDFLSDRMPLDLGHNVLPPLIGRMYGFRIREYLLDIGTLENYRKAQEEWAIIRNNE